MVENRLINWCSSLLSDSWPSTWGRETMWTTFPVWIKLVRSFFSVCVCVCVCVCQADKSHVGCSVTFTDGVVKLDTKDFGDRKGNVTQKQTSVTWKVSDQLNANASAAVCRQCLCSWHVPSVTVVTTWMWWACASGRTSGSSMSRSTPRATSPPWPPCTTPCWRRLETTHILSLSRYSHTFRCYSKGFKTSDSQINERFTTFTGIFWYFL